MNLDKVISYKNPFIFQDQFMDGDENTLLLIDYNGTTKKLPVENFVGFVYLLTNRLTGKKYVGCKKFRFKTSKKVAGKKRRVRGFKESDWKDYYGSNPTTSKLAEKDPFLFKREVLHLCPSQFDMRYLELQEQVNREVLFDENYYNQVINVRLRRKKGFP